MLYVDLMLPYFLLRPGRIMTDPQNVPHLVHAGKEKLSRHEKSDTLGTRRRSQTTWLLAKLADYSPLYVQNSEKLLTSLTAIIGLIED